MYSILYLKLKITYIKNVLTSCEGLPTDGIFVEQIENRSTNGQSREGPGICFKECSSILLFSSLHPVTIHSECTPINQFPHIFVLVRVCSQCGQVEVLRLSVKLLEMIKEPQSCEEGLRETRQRSNTSQEE